MSVRLPLILVTSTIFVLGLVMIFNTSSAEVLDMHLSRSTHHALIRQILYAIVGLFLGRLLYSIGYRGLLRMSAPLMGLLTFFLLLTFLPGIGIEANGSHRWIGVAGYSFQPSELVKFGIPLYVVSRFVQTPSVSQNVGEFLRLVAIVSVPLLLILIEPNNGTVAIIGAMLVVLCFLARINPRYWMAPMFCALIIGGVTAYNLPYVSGRLNVYFHPELDLHGRGHQPHQAKVAAGSGRLLGKGPGKSLQKLSYLPEAQNDYIAAIFGEEFGFVGILSLIVLYLSLGYLGFHIACHADRSGLLIAGSYTFLICFQAFLNMGVVSGLLPSTGVNLPLFSQGGTSLLANIGALGVLLDIDRTGDNVPNPLGWTPVSGGQRSASTEV